MKQSSKITWPTYWIKLSFSVYFWKVLALVLGAMHTVYNLHLGKEDDGYESDLIS